MLADEELAEVLVAEQREAAVGAEGGRVMERELKELKALFEAQDARWLAMGDALNVIAAAHPRADQTREEAERDARNRLRAVAEENGTTVADLNLFRRYADAVRSGDQAAARKARRRLDRKGR